MTGGGVMAGETPEQAACREVKEELGIAINRENIKLGFEHVIDRDDGTGLLVSVFMRRVRVPDGGFKFDPYEVNDVKIFHFMNFLSMYLIIMTKNFATDLKKLIEYYDIYSFKIILLIKNIKKKLIFFSIIFLYNSLNCFSFK